MGLDGGALDSIVTRQRREKKDKLYVKLDGNSVVVGNKIRLSIKHGDNIIILEDEFKSSYDCTTCKGVGEVEWNCLKCDGAGCSRCGGTGKMMRNCDVCKGKGALIELPDQAKSRPTSGTVQCVGPLVMYRFHIFNWHFGLRKNGYKQGDKVAYSGYTGHLIPFKGNTRLRIMRETEPFCLVEEIEGEAIGEEVTFVDKDTAYDLS